jgi:alkanesulfonate monooxygenase SsuD/methylene tetrahydromethanopterin reductase-like flavin-dependent oxidoreductase (luciferase family)
LHDSLEQIELADRLGLDEVWLGEHRFSRHGLLSGFLLARSSRVPRRCALVRLW